MNQLLQNIQRRSFDWHNFSSITNNLKYSIKKKLSIYYILWIFFAIKVGKLELNHPLVEHISKLIYNSPMMHLNGIKIEIRGSVNRFLTFWMECSFFNQKTFTCSSYTPLSSIHFVQRSFNFFNQISFRWSNFWNLEAENSHWGLSLDDMTDEGKIVALLIFVYFLWKTIVFLAKCSRVLLKLPLNPSSKLA